MSRRLGWVPRLLWWLAFWLAFAIVAIGGVVAVEGVDVFARGAAIAGLFLWAVGMLAAIAGLMIIIILWLMECHDMLKKLVKKEEAGGA